MFRWLAVIGIVTIVNAQNVQKPCPDGWVQYGQLCYMYSGSVQRSWLNAINYCATVGGQLAGAYNRSTLNFQIGLSPNPLYATWGGLYLDGSTWKFVDYTYSFNLYEMWAPGEPLANQGGCGAIRSGAQSGYFNVPCQNSQPFICSQKIATCDTSNLTAVYGVRGTVQSPNFPDTYSNNENCIQHIVANQSQFVDLAFDAWNVEPRYDYLVLYDGWYPGEDALVIANLTYDPTNITDNSTKPNFQTTSNVMTLQFITDNSVQRTGWHANYTLLVEFAIALN
ncbi:unnamed protein product, partial [Mesorhabditis spiculigera]